MAAASPPRTLWKGAITFGLVHIPIALHAATVDTRPRMRMVEEESGAPIGYKKVDKATGEEVAQSEISKGVEVGQGQFVTLSKEELRQALPRTTQTIEIESFVRLQDIPPEFFNKPYYTSPINRGQKVYALLRDVLKRTGRVGVGRVVISTKQHLAVVIPHGQGLTLNLLRWHDEVRDMASLPLPGDASEVGITDRELAMGEQLVLDLADEWAPERFRDELREKFEQLVEAKRQSGQVKVVEELAPQVLTPSADIVDLTELLRKSLRSAGAPQAESAGAPPAKPASRPRRQAANDEAARERERAAAEGRTPAKARTSVPVPRKKSRPE